MCSFQDGTCRFKKENVGAEDTGFVDITEGSEDELQKAVATVGPISVAIDASHFSFQFYHHGVYNERRYVYVYLKSDFLHNVLQYLEFTKLFTDIISD